MPSTYTNNLAIEQIGTGEQSGTWGNTTNLNFDLIDQSICGLGSIQLLALGTTGAPNLLPITNGSLSEGRNASIEYTSNGDLGVLTSAFVQLTPNTSERIITIKNSMTGSTALEVFQGTYDAGRSLIIANGDTVMCKFSGIGAASTVTALTTGLNIADLQAQESLTVKSATVGTEEFTISSKIVNAESSLVVGFSGATNGLQLATDTASVRLGINTTPETTETDTKLHVSGPGEVSLRLDSTGSNDANFRFCNDGERAFTMYYDQSNASFRIYDNVQLSTRFRINSDGSIIIAGTLEGRDISSDGAKTDDLYAGEERWTSITPAGSVNVDCNDGTAFYLSTNQNTAFAFINPPTTGTAFAFTLEVLQNGAFTLSWPAAVKWAGGAAPTDPSSGETNIYNFYTRDAGTTWYGVLAGAAFA